MKKTFTRISLLAAGLMFALNINAGTPFKEGGNPVPGTVEAEDYDKDGAETSYHWSNKKGQNGGGYRSDAEGIGGPKTVDGTEIRWIGELDGGAWTVYTITVAETGNYSIETFYAKGNDGNTSFELYIDDEKVATGSAPGTGSWEDVWKSVKSEGIALEAGTHTFKFSTGGGFNVDKFVFTKTGGYEKPATPVLVVKASETTTAGANKNGDKLGGPHTASPYSYTINLEKGGKYTIKAYTACAGGEHAEKNKFYIVFDGDATKSLGTEENPLAGPHNGWDAYEAIECGEVELTAGEHTYTFNIVADGNIGDVEFYLEGSTSSVKAVATPAADAAIYTINGVRVSDAAQKGVYIKNGRKFVVK